MFHGRSWLCQYFARSSLLQAWCCQTILHGTPCNRTISDSQSRGSHLQESKRRHLAKVNHRFPAKIVDGRRLEKGPSPTGMFGVRFVLFVEKVMEKRWNKWDAQCATCKLPFVLTIDRYLDEVLWFWMHKYVCCSCGFSTSDTGQWLIWQRLHRVFTGTFPPTPPNFQLVWTSSYSKRAYEPSWTCWFWLAANNQFWACPSWTTIDYWSTLRPQLSAFLKDAGAEWSILFAWPLFATQPVAYQDSII